MKNPFSDKLLATAPASELYEKLGQIIAKRSSGTQVKLLRGKMVVAALLLLVCGGFAQAQAAHQAVITWAAATDAVASSTYNVSRASGACPATGLGSLVFAKINAAPVSALTFTDAGLGVGTYCYFVTQVQSGAESIPSNTGGGVVRPNTVTIQIVIS